jgi:hypothetical protein
MLQQERRAERRYPVRQPAWIRLPGSGECRDIAATTENMSTRGVLLRSPLAIPLGAKIELTLRLANGPQLRGTGEVLRVNPSVEESFLVAVSCDLPLKIFR